jgi:superfamily II DNA or RNA helicase
VIFETFNTRARILSCTNEELAFVKNQCSFSETRYANNQHYEHRYVLFNSALMTIPAGLLEDLRLEARAAGILFDVVDNRTPPCALDSHADIAWLRDYQMAAVAAIAKHTRGIVWAATGSGKGEIVIALTRALPCQWLFLAHRTSLVEQQAERYERRTGLRAGRVGEGSWDIPDDATFVCASFQSIHAALERHDPKALALLLWAQGLAIDEVHSVAAKTLFRVSQLTRHAYWRVGLSGTPLARSDSRSVLVLATTGSVVYRIDAKQLIADGVLAKPIIRMTEVVQRGIAGSTWARVKAAAIVRSDARNSAVVACIAKAEKPCLVFVAELAHGKRLEKAVLCAGMHADFVWGAHSTEWRQAQIRRLVKGQLDVLVCSVIFQEGVDIPELRSVVIASGGKSVIAALQRIGRGMRVSAGKDTFEVWDFRDVGHRWLARHTQQRIDAYENEGHAILFVDS